MNYYVTTDGAEVAGPYSLGQLRAMWGTGAVTSNAICAVEGTDDWLPVERIIQPAAPTEAMSHPQSIRQSAKSRALYVLLALFLGGLGVHNFYAGHTKKAVFQLLTFVILGIPFVIPILLVWAWSIYDAITVRTDGLGRPFRE